METAKVDIRKLQLLNDRINQMMEVLNQVRLSVHGIQHTAQSSPVSPFGYPAQGLGYGASAGYPQQTPFFASQTPWQGAQNSGYGAVGGVGIGHSPWTGAMGTQQHVGADVLGGQEVLAARIQQTFPFLFAQQHPFGNGPFGSY